MALPSWSAKPHPRDLRSERVVIGRQPSFRTGAIVIPFWEGSGSTFYSSRGQQFVTSTAQPWAIGRYGPHWVSNATGPTGVADGPPLADDWRRWTGALVFRTTSTAFAVPVIMQNPSPDGQLSFGVNHTGSGIVRVLIIDNGSTLLNITSNQPTSNDGNWHVLMARSLAPASHDLWYDGAQVNTNTSTTIQPFLLTQMRIGSDYASNVYTGDVGLVVFWPFALPDGEMIRFSQNPFAILRPAIRRALGQAPATPGGTVLRYRRRRGG